MDLMKTLMVYLLLLTAGAANGSIEALPVPSTPIPTEAVTVFKAPVLTATPPISYIPLYPGNRGENVLTMQTRLQELGYLSDDPDGIYGPKTRSAVEEFQKDYHLTVDGLAGKNTLQALYGTKTEQTPAPVPTAAPTPAPTAEPTAVPTETPLAVPETAAPATNAVYPVQVEYIDQQTGSVLYQTEILLEENAAVYADNRNIEGAYKLCSPGAVSVSIRDGKAIPSSVTFSYIPDTVTYTLICADETGTVLNAETVTISRGESAVLMPSWNAARNGWQLTGEGSVSVTAGADDKEPPEPIMFTYQKLPAALPDDSLLPEGTTIFLEGESCSLPWYIDEAGTPFVCLNQLADAAGWPLENQRYSIYGQEVIFVFDGDELISLTVQDASYAEHALPWEGRLFVDQTFLEALGFTVSVDGFTLQLSRE